MEVSNFESQTRRSRSLPGSGLRTPGGSKIDRKGSSASGRRKSSFIVDKARGKCCGSTKMCWWEPDLEDVNDTVDFSLETSLHGLKYLCQPQRHLLERIFWLLAFITSLLIAAWLISDIWLKYMNSPVVVTFQPYETTIDQIPFPAITVCNMNKVQKSKADEYIREAKGVDWKNETIHARKNLYYMEHVCSASKSFSQKFNYTSKRDKIDPRSLEKAWIRDGDDEQSDVARFLRVASQKCSEMLLLCLWEDEIHDCSQLFKPIETDFGKCCTFNMMPQTLLSRYLNDSREDPNEVSEWAAWDYEKSGLLLQDPNGEEIASTFPRRQKRAGTTSGLSILLNPDLDEYFCTSSDSQGFRLVKHLPLDVPHVVDFGTAIRPNAEVFVGIRPEITLADPDIRNFKLSKRNCYFRGEFQLAYFNYYTASNCFDECLANQTYATCGCVRYYMPRDDTRDLCGASKFSCAEEVRNLLTIESSLQTGIKSSCDFCLPTCTEVEYISQTTVTPIQRGLNLWYDVDDSTAPWAHKNVSIVHIFFSSDSTYARVRKELYGIVDLIANTGGLMGLCLGFSGLSLVELLYFYTLRAWCRNRRRRSIWAIVGLKLHRMMKKSKARDERYNNGGGLRPGSGRINSADSDSFHTFRRPQPFERPGNNVHDVNEDNISYLEPSQMKNNPFIVVPEDSKPTWGRFSGFGSQFSNSRVVN